MSTSLQPLLTLLAQTERERDQALAESQRAAQSAQAAQAQLDQLLDYRREYETRWSAQFAAGRGAAELLHCYRGFMERLTMAVDQQQRVAAHAATRAEQSRAVLQQHELRVASVRKLIEKRSREIRLAADRREQKQSDEIAARLAARGNLMTRLAA